MDNKKNEIDKSHVENRVSGGGGVIKGPSTFNKLARIIFTDDPEAAMKIWRKNVLIPTIKKTTLDAIAALIYGQPVNFGTSSNIFNPYTGQTNYNAISNGASAPSNALMSGPVSGGKQFNGTVYFEDQADISAYQKARQTYEEMLRILSEYKWVRLAELYEIADIPGIDYVSNAWGWSDLTGTNIFPSGKGYILQLPPVRSR